MVTINSISVTTSPVKVAEGIGQSFVRIAVKAGGATLSIGTDNSVTTSNPLIGQFNTGGFAEFHLQSGDELWMVSTSSGAVDVVVES